MVLTQEDKERVEKDLNIALTSRLEQFRQEIPEDLLSLTNIFPIGFVGVFTGRSGAINVECTVGRFVSITAVSSLQRGQKQGSLSVGIGNFIIIPSLGFV